MKPKPFFNRETEKIGTRFWMPCLNLDYKESKDFSNKNSWFNTDALETDIEVCQQQQCSIADYIKENADFQERKETTQKQEEKRKRIDKAKERKLKTEKEKKQYDDENPDLYELKKKREQTTFTEKLIDIKSKKRKRSLKTPVEKKERKKAAKKPKPNNSIKVRIYLSPEQELLYKTRVGTGRWIYNMCINIEKYDVLRLTGSYTQNLKDLRAFFSSPQTIEAGMKQLQSCGGYKLHSSKNLTEEKVPYQWVFATPAKLRDEPIRDFLKNRKSAIASVCAKKIQGKVSSCPTLKYRSSKQPQQSLTVPCQDWKTSNKPIIRMPDKKKQCKERKTNNAIPKSSLRDLFAKDKLLTRNGNEYAHIPDKLAYDARLVRTRDRKYYFCIPRLKSPRDNQAPINNPYGIISLDPGVRTFMTGYDPTGKVFKWGHNDMIRICKLAIHYDKIHSKCAQKEVKHHYRYKLRKAARKIQEKIRDLVNELHKKLALFLCQNYRVILLPKFETSQMMKRFNRRISRKTVRQMVTWAHYRFQQFLLHKQKEFPWCKVIICYEAYTSKTCGNCGYIHNKLGGSKVFKCPKCGLHADRDIHAARNILLLFLTVWKSCDENKNRAELDRLILDCKLDLLPRILH